MAGWIDLGSETNIAGRLRRSVTVINRGMMSENETGEARVPAQGLGPVRRRSLVGAREGAVALGALALGALALGAVAVGAVAIGRLAVGRLTLGRARLRRARMDELRIEKLTVKELRVERLQVCEKEQDTLE